MRDVNVHEELAKKDTWRLEVPVPETVLERAEAAEEGKEAYLHDIVLNLPTEVVEGCAWDGVDDEIDTVWTALAEGTFSEKDLFEDATSHQLTEEVLNIPLGTKFVKSVKGVEKCLREEGVFGKRELPEGYTFFQVVKLALLVSTCAGVLDILRIAVAFPYPKTFVALVPVRLPTMILEEIVEMVEAKGGKVTMEQTVASYVRTLASRPLFRIQEDGRVTGPFGITDTIMAGQEALQHAVVDQLLLEFVPGHKSSAWMHTVGLLSAEELQEKADAMSHMLEHNKQFHPLVK